MAKGRGMRGHDGSTVPTNKVIRTASYVSVRGKPRHELRVTGVSSKVKVSYNAGAVANFLADFANSTVRS